MRAKSIRKKINHPTTISLCALILVNFGCINRIQSSIHILEQTAVSAMADVQLCELEGTVFDDQKKSLPGATIRIQSVNGESFEDYSDERGNFSFTNLPPGTYSVVVTLE